jgi:hypothetical protein
MTFNSPTLELGAIMSCDIRHLRDMRLNLLQMKAHAEIAVFFGQRMI